MADFDKSEALTEQLELTDELKQKLSAAFVSDEEAFAAGQREVDGDLAAAAELRACWSTPILSRRGKVLGSFAMYYREPQAPTGDEARLTEVATRLAGKAIESQGAGSTYYHARKGNKA